MYVLVYLPRALKISCLAASNSRLNASIISFFIASNSPLVIVMLSLLSLLDGGEEVVAAGAGATATAGAAPGATDLRRVGLGFAGVLAGAGLDAAAGAGVGIGLSAAGAGVGATAGLSAAA